MVMQKRKAVSKLGDSVLRQTKAAKKVKEEELEEEVFDEATEKAEKEVEDPEAAEEALEKQEATLQAARKKELKGMYIDQLKQLAADLSLEVNKKDDIIQAVIELEAQTRAAARAHEEKIRSVVVQKKTELEKMGISELKELCSTKGITGQLAKPARVEQLLKLWQEDDGVDKALAKMASDARLTELEGMDLLTLKMHCNYVGVSPFVKEVMVERLLRTESATGCFSRPTSQAEEEPAATKAAAKGDVVDALLANEASRKRERELKKQQEDVAEAKKKELKSMPNEGLKQLLISKGQEPGAKKEDMVKALMTICAQEAAAAARRMKFKSLPLDELKKLVLSKGLSVGKKDEMIEALLAREAKLEEAAKAFEARLEEVLQEKRAELDVKSAQELKDLCAQKGLKLGVGKEDRLERLLEAAKTNGELDQMLEVKNRDARRQELSVMAVDGLEKLCEQSGTDPLVKQVMVERLLEHEAVCGVTTLPKEEPAKKKQRTSKK
mmetsp:Transcript_51883/g.121359  ORF Transcript_51883/g.121359 Transcript_51883/m.121359 type:complete len:497 (-) Transcript_51883:78-1568(-)